MLSHKGPSPTRRKRRTTRKFGQGGKKRTDPRADMMYIEPSDAAWFSKDGMARALSLLLALQLRGAAGLAPSASNADGVLAAKPRVTKTHVEYAAARNLGQTPWVFPRDAIPTWRANRDRPISTSSEPHEPAILHQHGRPWSTNLGNRACFGAICAHVPVLTCDNLVGRCGSNPRCAANCRRA